MKELIIKDTIEEYLSVSKYINWKENNILSKADEFKHKYADEISLIKASYEFVRDEIKHSWDVQDKRVTKSATEVLEQGVGICWAKANLLAALLRACGMPAGICYQRLTLGDVPETGFCIHALNAVYIKSLNRWIRLDARGNKTGVDAQFDLEQEQLAFSVRSDLGEVDYGIVYANPSEKLMQVLEENTDALYMYLNCLPDSIFEYKKATVENIDELVKTRVIVLRAANKLSDDVDMSVVEKESYTYDKRALETGEHIAYLVYDNGTFIGAGGVSFYQVMPTYHNPTGRKAYIMNSGEIIENNKTYWNEHADLWFGTTALPVYGVRFPTEDDLHLFGDVTDKKMLEVCCGSGHSLKYNAEKGAGELWGVDLSQKQLDNAARLLNENGYSAKLMCAKMEDELAVPKDYFDYVYSIYGIGWTTDLQGTFDKIALYLKKDGIFIFSWHHTLNYCVAWSCNERKEVFENDKLVWTKSYYDESYFKMPVHDSEIVLCNRKMSTYINALAKAGFFVEQLIEESDEESLNAGGDIDPKTRKAQVMPISFCIKARKL